MLLRPTMVGILRCGKMLPQLNLVIEIEFADALLSGRSLVFSYPTVHTQQSSVPNGVAERNVTVARAFTKLMGAFVTFWDNDAGSKIHLLANPGQDVAPIGAARQEDSLLESQMQLGSLQYPHNPMKGASEHFHFLSVLAGTYDDTVRNGLPAPQLHCRLSRRARAQDAAEWRQHPLGRPCPVHLQGPGRHDDGPVHSFGGLPAGDALRHGRLCA